MELLFKYNMLTAYNITYTYKADLLNENLYKQLRNENHLNSIRKLHGRHIFIAHTLFGGKIRSFNHNY